LHRTYEEIYNESKGTIDNIAVDAVWSLEKVIKNGDQYTKTEEKLTVTETQMNAICAAYADYIWAKVQAE
jgi:hypothetical protein